VQFASFTETQHRYRNMSASPHVPSFIVTLPALIPGATSGDDEDMPHGRDPIGNAILPLANGRSQAAAAPAPPTSWTDHGLSASWRQTSDTDDNPMAREILIQNYEKAMRMFRTLKSQQDH
jgi:hypothetical protein